MKKRQDKIEALIIASIVINELQTSDCTNSQKVKDELGIIATTLSKRVNRLNSSLTSVCEHERTRGCDGLYYCEKCGIPM